MRKTFLLLLSSILLFSCGKNITIADFAAYPKLKTINDKLDEEYTIYRDPKISFTVAKKPEGWFVVKADRRTSKPIAEEQYWSSKTKTYSRIPQNFFRTPDAAGEKTKIAYETRYNDYAFDHSVYYGYENWEDDAIDALEGANNLNDTLTEALARAYASKCITITRPAKHVSVRLKKMSDEKAESFCSYGNKLIETYKKLLVLNPAYETIVGKVQTKLSNEYVFLWAELKQGGRPEADQFLVAGLYDDLMLNFAKNMLNGAEKNAIIFCNGDNDTFPLWYVQAKLGVRKDVAVMNTSLMNLSSWILSARENYVFDLGLSEKLYNDTTTDAVFLNDTRDGIFSMRAFAAGIEGNKPEFLTKGKDNATAMLVPFKTFRLSYEENDSLAPVVKFRTSYLLKSDIAAMDIIASNLDKRPIYFAQTAVYGNLTDALAHNLLQQGLLVKVTRGTNKGELSGDKYYDVETYYQNLCDNYTYGFEKLSSLQAERIAINYIYNFHNLAELLREKGDTVRATKAVEACMKKIPVKIFSDPVAAYMLGDDLCKTGNPGSGRKLLEMAVDKIRIAYTDPKNEEELDHYDSVLSGIVMTAQKNGFKELGDSAQELDDKIKAKMPPPKYIEY